MEDTGKISDGYHTFDELYDHRVTLYIALCRMISFITYKPDVWRSQLHSDGSKFDGWFVLGIDRREGHQITYHIPMKKWSDTDFAYTLDKAPKWDGHTSNDVLERIAKLI